MKKYQCSNFEEDDKKKQIYWILRAEFEELEKNERKKK